MSTKRKTQRTAIYVRVSTQDQNSEMQIAECSRLAEFRGWDNVKVYADHAVSGTKHSRPALDEMLRDVRDGKVKRVLVWKLDRLGRSALHMLGIVDELERLGVGFVSMTEQFDTTSPMGRAVVSILAAIAQLERDTTAERTRAALKHARDRGARLGRPKVCTLSEVARSIEEGLTTEEICEKLSISRRTLMSRRAALREMPH